MAIVCAKVEQGVTARMSQLCFYTLWHMQKQGLETVPADKFVTELPAYW